MAHNLGIVPNYPSGCDACGDRGVAFFKVQRHDGVVDGIYCEACMRLRCEITLWKEMFGKEGLCFNDIVAFLRMPKGQRP